MGLVQSTAPLSGAVKSVSNGEVVSAGPHDATHDPALYPVILRRSVLAALAAAYGSEGAGEVGHGLAGHRCVTPEELEAAHAQQSSLLYGELLPAGVQRALDDGHLQCASAATLVDLGSGVGKAHCRRS
jgi:hypothetical protein